MVQVMAQKYTKKQALEDLEDLLGLCATDLEQIKDSLGFIPTSHIQIQRYMCLALAYSQWERFFRQSHGICFRLIQSVYKKNSNCPASLQPVWYRRSREFQKLVQFINTDRKLEAATQETKSPFEFADKLLRNTQAWVSSTMGHEDIDSLVVTFSNVDKKVVEFNAKILGIDQDPKYKNLDLGELNNLVGRRNDVAHGGFKSSIGRRQMNDFLSYTTTLCVDYNNLIRRWIKKINTRPEQ